MAKEEQKERIFSESEIRRLIDNSETPLRHIIMVAINTGMRKSEILNLEWDQVNLEGGFITIVEINFRLSPYRPLLKINESKGVLYTTGYVPSHETFPGVHIPSGLQIDIIGESSLREISKEILALTKLNFNNCNFYDSLPITLRFSKRVGEIVQYIDDETMPPTKYYYYM